MNTPTLEQVVGLALQLSPAEQEQLLEQVAAQLSQKRAYSPKSSTWGADVVALLDAMDLSMWDAEDIDDPVEWVRQQREEQAKNRGLDWGDNP